MGGRFLDVTRPGTRVKFCGITRAEDARQAAALGVDAVGLVFYPPSPRALSPRQAAEVVPALPPRVSRVGLFVDPAPGLVERTLEVVDLDLLQFHGDEAPELCRGYPLPYLKALRLAPGLDVAAVATTFPDAFGLLLDTYRPGVYGGTGQGTAWSRVPHLPTARVVLAGGLRPGRVAAAIERVRPYALDVSSGIEAEPGIKSPELMSAFMREVRYASPTDTVGADR